MGLNRALKTVATILLWGLMLGILVGFGLVGFVWAMGDQL